MSDYTAPAPTQSNFSPRNFGRLADLIQSYSGIKMPRGKKTMLAGRLNRRMRDLALDSPDAYCQYLFEDSGLETEIVALIDAVTTNKTDFFRESAHFDFLTEVALPELAASGRRSLKLWSAAASVGAEAYTLAMVLEEYCRPRGLDYAILATDICTEVLRQALAGRFPRSMVDLIPTELRRRYVMMACDPAKQEFRIVPRLRAKVSWARLNLMDERYPVGTDYDIVFCRNVLIYFDKETQSRVLTRLCDHLRPGGYLVLGHSETLVGAALPVNPVANTVFQRR